MLGGARSGKSRRAEELAEATGKRLCYLATATAGDSEMAERIARHRRRRGAAWQLREEPLALAAALRELDGARRCVLVECLTMWLSNCLHEGCWEEQREALCGQLERCRADVILVGNEVGSGIVPLGELSREFVDHSGRLHQRLAERCDRVSLVVAGQMLALKAGAGS